MTESAKNPGGRKSLFKDEYIELAYRYALLGATNEQMASFFGVTPQTLDNWKNSNEQFFDALNRGKLAADANVAFGLYSRAVGYCHSEDDIRVVGGEIVITPTMKHYPPDTTACIFWLKNRHKLQWRQVIDQSDTDGEDVESVNVKVTSAKKPRD